MGIDNKELYIDCDGNKVHAKIDFPAGQQEKMPMVVLIPGFTGFIEEPHIVGITRAINKIGFAVLRVELFGHGKSDGKFVDHNVLIWMSQAARVIDYARRLPFVSSLYLAGHSQGGLTAVLAAGIMEEFVKGMIALSPGMSIPEDIKSGHILGTTFDPDHIPEYLNGDWWELSGHYIRTIRFLPIKETIAAYRKPVLVIHGTADGAVPAEAGRRLADEYADARFVAIEGDDHCYNYHIDKVEEAVQEFLLEMEGQ